MAESSAGAGSHSQTGPGLTWAISILERFNPVVRWLCYLGGAFLFLFVCFMFLDVLLRYLFDRPIPGSVDIGTIVLEVIGFFGVAYVQLEKGHLVIDILTSRLRPSTALVLSTAMYIVCLAVVGVLAWQGVLNTLDYYRIGKLSYTGMPLFPSAAVAPFGCIILFFVFLRDILSQIVECLKLRLGVATWLLMLGVPVLWIVFMAFWIQPILPGIDLLLVGSIGILVTIMLCFLGMPIGFVLIMMAIVLMGYASGAQGAWMASGSMIYTHATTYGFIVIPLYTIMAYFILVTGLGADAYLAAYRWLGHFRGGLAMASIIGSSALAAVQGGPVAAIVTLGPLACPEMRKYKYNEGLAGGVIAAGAILGPIIPPSLGFVMFGILANVSIGKLFIAGIIPGLILATFYILQIIIQCRLNPSLAPAGVRASWRERLSGLPVFGPVVALFLLIIGGIYAGVFSAMEGGGIGAFMALVIALTLRRVTWQNFKTAILDSMKFTCMLFLVIVGGLVFGNALGASGLSGLFIEFLVGLGVTPTLFLVIVMFIYILWGVICDAPIIIILTVPILAPIAKALGIDLIWFGVLTTINVGLGTITPPFAMNLFMLRAVAMRDVSLGVIYRGIIPFCITTFVVMMLILFFPALATWLPGLMR